MIFKKGSVFLLATMVAGFSSAQNGSNRIQLNQVGFYPAAPKLAVVTGKTEATKFSVTSPDGGTTFYTGTLSGEKRSKFSSILTKTADFSAFKKSGKYAITVPGIGTSHPFTIAEGVHADAARAVLKAFYFIRSDTPLEEKFAGQWARPAGHPDTEVVVHPSAASNSRPAGTVLSSPGGWYDAGDYNKYIVNSGITMGTLFAAFEDFPQYYKRLTVAIPESNNPVPDILDEAVYNLRWMLTMQDPSDGGVYHKLTNAAFDGMVMPGVTMAPRYVVQKGTAAALDFAAVTAQAARILSTYKAQFPGLADSCLAASAKAWQWAQKNPSVIYSQREINPKHDPDITTGEYGDRNFKDEWLWAAAELYTTTKEQQYLEVLKERMPDAASLPSWGNVAMMGYFTLIRSEKTLPPAAKPVVAAMKDTVLKRAATYLSNVSSNAFSTVMGQNVKDFSWGGSSVAANQGMLLLYAYKLTKDKKYLHGALANLDYLLGRNATGYSFVTGIGSKRVMHPHHRPSEADGIVDPVPGLLSGGPNPGRQDSCNYPSTEPELAFVDDVCSYASNEIAINWQAPMVYLVNAIEAWRKEL
ncbi:MAG TPA: glycoside hydrolase family 9 protein [Flavisolibacter sp.]|jgi:endoglucanase|nr:glycoside hydrolase family 9 protein [Flavisolibacter sp.]